MTVIRRRGQYRLELVHELKSPHYAEANGVARKNLGLLEHLMKKCQEVNQYFKEAVLIFCSTTQSPDRLSPTHLFFEMRLRILRLPALPDWKEEDIADVQEQVNKMPRWEETRGSAGLSFLLWSYMRIVMYSYCPRELGFGISWAK